MKVNPLKTDRGHIFDFIQKAKTKIKKKNITEDAPKGNKRMLIRTQTVPIVYQEHGDDF